MKKNNSKIETVLVAMSGGIDSSVCTFLLKDQGFRVTGVYFKMTNTKNDKNYQRAKRVATLLGIRLVEKNISRKFKREVVDYFLDTYRKNQTPNPCVVCNQKIKFKLLKEEAKKLGCGYIATGHYVGIKKRNDGGRSLVKGRDNNKDQSYFLYRLQQPELRKVIFPLGDLEKKAVIEMASKSILRKVKFEQESQDVCFFGKNRGLEKFLLSRVKKLQQGSIVNEKGEILGKHKGLLLYTKGQRQGLNLAGGPFFVIGKNLRKNELIVTKNKRHSSLLAKKIRIKNTNWIDKAPKRKNSYQIKIRYGGSATGGRIKKTKNGWEACLSKRQWAVTAGQSLVVYEGRKLIGGGIIIDSK